MNHLNYLIRIKTIFAVFFITLSLIACKKQITESEPQIDKNLVSNVRTLANSSTSVRLAFSMLNPQEKFYLIQEQLDFVLLNIPINDKQKDLISKIKNTMPSDIYDNFNSKKKFINEFQEMEKEGLQILGKEFMQKYFSTIIDINTTDKSSLTPTITNAVGGGNGCTCSTQSDWCNDKDGQVYTCAAAFCTVGNGCGSLFLYDCNGKCMRSLD